MTSTSSFESFYDGFLVSRSLERQLAVARSLKTQGVGLMNAIANRENSTRQISVTKKLFFTFVIVSMAFALLGILAELLVRWRRDAIWSWNSVHQQPPPLLQRVSVEYDAELGWIPKKGFRQTDHPRITIDEQSFRANVPNSNRELAHDMILAIGDSFTFGAEVDDDETWPAYLEDRINQPVLNAGCNAYGFDQIVLRAERLVECLHPRVLIVCLVADDVNRCQFSFRWAWKPFFRMSSGEITLQNQPVPRGPAPEPVQSTLRSILGYSQFADAVCLRTMPEWWLSNQGIVQDHRDGIEVSCRLVDRLAKITKNADLPLLLVFEYARASDRNWIVPVVSHAKLRGLPTLDLTEELQIRIDKQIGSAEPWFLDSHLSARGNSWVAHQIAAKLTALNLAAGPRHSAEGPTR